MLRHPHITFSVMILLIGFALIARGVIEMVAAFMEDSMTGWGRIFAVILGLLAIAVGVIMLFQPVAGGVTFVWVLGLFALVTGPMELAAASHIRKSLKA